MTRDTPKRIINFRPMFFGAILLCCSILFTMLIIDSLWYLILAFAVIVAIAGVCIYFKKFKRLIILSCLYILGFVLTLMAVFTFSNTQFDGKTYVITGRVNAISNFATTYYVTLGNVAASEGKDSYNLGGQVQVTIYGINEDDVLSLNLGDKLVFSGKLTSKHARDNNGWAYKNNIKYTTTSNIQNITIVNGGMMFDEIIKQQTLKNLEANLGRQKGGMAYAALFGDKTLLDDNIYSLFKTSGTAHLLAVSGLHVGFLIALLWFLLTRFKINKWVRFSIMTAILLFYCYLCAFSPSVIRASIMGIVFILASVVGRRNDSLSSLGLAAIIILLIKPLYLFDVGFLLSFGTVLCIVLTLRLINKINIKNKVIRRVLQAMAMTFIATAASYPITASYFGTLPIYSVFANLLIVPLFGIGYILLFVTVLISLILPFMTFSLILPDAMFSIIIYLNGIFASLPLAVVRAVGFGLIGAVLFYGVIFVISHYTMIKRKFKGLCCCIILPFCVTMIIVNSVPIFNNQNAMFCGTYENGYYSLIATENFYYAVDIIPTRAGLRAATEDLQQKKITKLNGIIFTTMSKFEGSLLSEFIEYFDNPIIVVPEGHPSISSLKSSRYKLILSSEDKKVLPGGLSLTNFIDGSKVLATLFEVRKSNIVFIKNTIANSNKTAIENRLDFEIDYLFLQDGDKNNLNINFNKLILKVQEIRF